MNKIIILSRYLIIIPFLDFFCLCNHHSANVDSSNCDSSYKVYKIDSINDFYLIYALKKNIRYKIISKKKNCSNGNRILKDNCYDFKLSSRLYNDSLITPGLAGCIYVDNTTKICVEDSIYDLSIASNIVGLNFIKKQ